MTNAGQKYLMGEMKRQAEEYRAQIYELQKDNALLESEKTSYQQEILSYATSKFIPALKRLLRLRKDYKNIES